MKETLSLRPAKELLIVAFCLWHCAAVAVYLLPNGTPEPLSSVISQAKGVVTPYMLSFSQWQWWDIFSPDPMRRASEYRIDININGMWKPVRFVTYNSLPWAERAKEIKILERLEDDWGTLIPFYLRPICATLARSEGSTVRLVAVSTILPDRLDRLSRLSLMPVTPTERVLGSVLCSHP